MTALRIKYRSGAYEVTERVISDIEVEPPDMIHAHCHLRDEGRSFSLKRIQHATDLDTGEVIADLWAYFGLTPPEIPPAPQMPVFAERPMTRAQAESANLRKADKRNLFNRFRLAVIAESRRLRLWALFNDRCYRCGSPGPIEIDHHIPQQLGGRLVPGNIVLLCSRCNAEKRDRHPATFYSSSQLAALEPILKAQLALFDFRFDWNYWQHRPKEYLVSVGVQEELAQAVLTDRSHPMYAGPQQLDEEDQ